MFSFLAVSTAMAGDVKSGLSSADMNKIADAIYRVEGGSKTKYPYGIMSVKTTNPRQICINTISNNFIRFNKLQTAKCTPPQPNTHNAVPARRLGDGKTPAAVSVMSPSIGTPASGISLEFVHFLADRYCPPSVDPLGNQRWKKNMTSILKLK